jgi:hypothetical protein
MISRILSRTFDVYRMQVVITVMALALIAAAALSLDNPFLLEWHNSGPFFADPVEHSVGLALLTYQLGYFNILPLYVVLLGVGPAIVLLARVSRWLLFSASAALYLMTLVFEVTIPSWPGDGSWFFNPLAWQFLFVLGYLTCIWARESEPFRTRAAVLMPLGGAIAALGLVSVLWGIRPDPYGVPEPRLMFVLEKSFLSPLRLIEFLAVVLVFHRAYPLVERVLGRLVSPISRLGRHSLEVFAVGSVLSLAAQLVRATVQPNLFLDALLVSSGILAMVFTAWFSEWRSRLPDRPLRR